MEIKIEKKLNDSELSKVLESKMFKKWKESIEVNLGSNVTILIKDVKWFGDKVGILDCELTYKILNKEIKRVCILRGNSVAALVVYATEVQKYFMMVEQFRSPAGDYVLECPAGISESDDALSDIKREILEEIGYDIKSDNCVINKVGVCYNSPGLLDEKTELFIIEIEGNEYELKNFCDAKTGTTDEHIIVRVITPDEISDFKSSAVTNLLVAKYFQNKMVSEFEKLINHFK